MIYYFITSPKSGEDILIGAQDGQLLVITDLIAETEKLSALAGFKNVGAYLAGDKTYIELVYDISAFTEPKQIINLANIESCSDQEVAVLSAFLPYIETGVSAVQMPKVSIIAEEGVGVQELAAGSYIYNKLTESTLAQEESAREDIQEPSSSDDVTSVFTDTESSTKQTVQPSVSKDIIYYKDSGDYKYIYAVKNSKGVVISVRDILRLPATADYVCSLAQNKDQLYGIFEMVGSAPVCHIILTNQLAQSSRVEIRDASNLSSDTDSETVDRIERDYSAMNEGIQVFLDREHITVPYVDCVSLSYVLYAGGDHDAYEAYSQLYSKCNPKTSNQIQLLSTDKLNISIPKYKDIQTAYAESAEEQDSSDDDAADTGDTFEEIIQSYADLNVDISTNNFNLTKDYAGTIDFHDCLFYKEAAMIVKPNDYEHYISLIEGQPENNDMPILDTELETYLALRNLAVYDICTEKSLYTVDDVNGALSIGCTGRLITKFFGDMLEQAYALNWQHTGDVLQTPSTDDLDADDLADGGTGLYSCYYRIREVPKEGGGTEFEKVPAMDPSAQGDSDQDSLATKDVLHRMQAKSSGLELIRYQLNGKNIINSFGYIDAIIRLLRWGDIKPSAIYIPSYVLNSKTPVESEAKKYVDLTQKVISEFSGVFKDTDREVFSDGAYYLVEGQISMTVANGYHPPLFNSTVDPGSVFLCGVILKSNYAKYQVSQLDFIDIFTLASGIADGLIKVHGISYNKELKRFALEQTDAPLNYDASRSFSSESVEVNDVTKLVQTQTDSARVALYPSSSLLKCYRLIGHLLPRMSNKAYPGIFKLLGDSVYEINDVIAKDCMNAVSSDVATVQSVMRKYSLDESAFVEYAFIQSVAQRFIEFNKAFDNTTGTLLDALQCALQVDISYSSTVTSAQKSTTETYTVDSILAGGLEACYALIHPATKQPMCYLGLAKVGEKPVMAIWREGEKDVSNITYERYDYRQFLGYLKKIAVSSGGNLLELLNVGFVKNVAPEVKAKAQSDYKKLQGVFLVETKPELLPDICKEIIRAAKGG